MARVLLLLCLGLAQVDPGETNSETTTKPSTAAITTAATVIRSTADGQPCRSSLTEAIVTLQIRAFNKLKDQLFISNNALVQKEEENRNLRQQLEDMKLASVKEAQAHADDIEAEKNLCIAEVESMSRNHSKGMERKQVEFEERVESMIATHKTEVETMTSDCENIMERQKVEYEEQIERLKLTYKSEVDSNEEHITNLTKTFKDELLEQTEMKTELKNNLEGSEVLVAFLMTVLEESEDRMGELEGLITEQGNKLQEMKIDHERYRKKEKSFYNSMTNRTDTNKELLREVMHNSETIISFNEALNRTHLRVKALEWNNTKCDIPTYLTEGLLTQERELREYKAWVKVEENIETLLSQIVEELLKQEKGLNMTDFSWDMMTKCQGVVEKQSTSMQSMRDLMSYTMVRTPALRYNHNGEGQLVSAAVCQCLPQPSENATVFLEVSHEDKWTPMWTEWIFTNCRRLSINSSEYCGDGTKKRTRLASLDEAIWNEEEEEEACLPCPVDGGWSDWSGCTRTCGGGSRSRSCSNPAQAHGGQECQGRSNQPCNILPCPAPKILSFLSYPNNMDKTYVLEAAQGLVIAIKFTAFDVENQDNCSYDYLTITEGDGTVLMDRTCGSNLPPDIISTTNNVRVIFHTDSDTTRPGWSLEWTAVSPGN